jgi:hypothetical protein
VATGTVGRGSLPSFGVLLSVFHRIRYYPDALRSIARQEGVLPEVQVVIVHGPGVEIQVPSELKARGWRYTVIASDAPGEGRFLADGLRQITADVVLPLDDDDLWAPTRLATVAEQFAAHPTVGYYHNAQRFVDADGRPLDTGDALRRLRRFSGPPVGPWRIAAPSDLRRSPGAIARWGSAFNNSSAAIRREILDRAAGELARAGWLFDLFLFYAAASDGASLLFDPAPLTTYRIHANNRSLGEGAPRASAIPTTDAAREGRIASLEVIREMVERRGPPWLRRWVDRDRAYIELLEGVRGGARDRVATARSIARLVRRLRYGDPVMNVVMAFSAAGQVAFPSTVRRAYWSRE